VSHQINLSRIKTVHIALKDLKDQVVFVGGSTVSLYADRQAFEFRGTDDVDVIIKIANYPEHIKFEEELRNKGFVDDIQSKIRGRFKIKNVTVDVIPTTDIAMGFTNIWYTEGFKNAMLYTIDNSCVVKILSPPFFIATKLEAFKGRGNNDGRTSHDFEDIIYILENRSNIWQEMDAAPSDVRMYLKTEFTLLTNQKYIHEWVDCHVDITSPLPADRILQSMDDFIAKM